MLFEVFMIVKNEEEMVAGALETVKEAESIVVVDTGSTDKTLEIVKKYTDKIYTDYKWNDDFAEAKNYALSKCTADWVMSIDADCRLEKGGIAKILKAIKNAKHNVIKVKLFSGKSYHYRPKIFTRTPDHYHVGMNQEYVAGTRLSDDSDISIEYLDSPNHKKDPDRNMRSLKKALAKNPKLTREKFYLAREYFYKKNYPHAIYLFDKYLSESKWLAEKAEAYYHKSLCWWYLNEGDKARESVLQALAINADMKKALELMAKMSWPDNKKKWLEYAKIATSNGVLFKTL